MRLHATSIALLGLLILFNGCSDSDEDKPFDDKKCRVASMIFRDATIVYAYDSEGRIIKVTFSDADSKTAMESTVEYNTEGKLAKIVVSNDDYATFSHIGDDQIVETRYTRQDSNAEFVSRTINYNFDGKGRLVSRNDFYHPSYKSYRYEYDANDNVSRTYITTDGVEWLATEVIDLDKGKSPHVSIFPTVLHTRNGVLVSATFTPGKNTNNEVFLKSYKSDGTLFEKRWQSYHYNASGYPTHVDFLFKPEPAFRETQYSYYCE
jgi:hypothetical protein